MACKCCSLDKEKEEQRVAVPDSPALGSPIVLAPSSDQEESSDSSYVTPPLAARSPSIVSPSLDTPLQLVEEELDVSVRPPGIGWPLAQRTSETSRNVQNHLGVVRGQRAYRTLGPLKHLFDPYPTVRRFLDSAK